MGLFNKKDKEKAPFHIIVMKIFLIILIVYYFYCHLFNKPLF